jgi:hypothetical protein
VSKYEVVDDEPSHRISAHYRLWERRWWSWEKTILLATAGATLFVFSFFSFAIGHTLGKRPAAAAPTAAAAAVPTDDPPRMSRLRALELVKGRSKDEVKGLWGRPDKVKDVGANTVWEYENKRIVERRPRGLGDSGQREFPRRRLR